MSADAMRRCKGIHLWLCLLFAGAAPLRAQSGSQAEIVLQRGHDLELLSAVYSPDGRIIASSGESEAIRLWDRESGDLIGTLPGHSERVIGLMFSPDGKWLASSSTDGTVKVWDYHAWKLVHFFKEHAGRWTRRVAFSPDSQRLTAATYDGRPSVWDLKTGAVLVTLPVGKRVSDTCFTPDGRTIITASREDDAPLVECWDAATGAPGLKLPHTEMLRAVAVSRDGRLLVSGGPKMLAIWELPSGRLHRQITMADREAASDIDLSPDGSLIATSGQWASRIRSATTGAVLCELWGHEDGTQNLNFSTDGTEVVTATADATLRLWNVRDGSLKRVFPKRPPNTPVTSLTFSADGRFEALGSADGVVRVWDARDGRFIYEMRGHEGAVLTLGFSRDAAWLFSGSADRTMRVWDLSHGTVSTIHPYFDRVDAIGTLSVGGTESLIASASGPFANASLDHSIKLWQSHFDRPVRVLEGHVANVTSLAFAAQVDVLASASSDGAAKLWNSRTGECLLTRNFPARVGPLVFAPDATWLAAGLADGTVHLLAARTLETLRQWPAHRRPVQTLAMSADGRRLATGGGDGTVAIWDATNGAEVRRFDHVTSQYLPLAFHPTQPVLSFASRDDTIVHTSIATGEVLFQRVLFSDGEWLAWNPAKMFYLASPRGDEHARIRFGDQLTPVYPLELYRRELRRESIAAFHQPAPLLEKKNLALWWIRYPYKSLWGYGSLPVVAVWLGSRLRRGWLADRRRRRQEEISLQHFVAQEAERKRIAAGLHDSLGQNLLVIKNRLYLTQQNPSAPGAAAQFEEISNAISQTLQEVREISHDLRPYQLDRLGLTKAVEAVVKRAGGSGGMTITSRLDPIDGLFAPGDEIHFYRIVQESLTNILKHSAAANARVTIENERGSVKMKIVDDGRGFDYQATMNDANASRGFGLTGLAERVRILGGRFECASLPRMGTVLTFDFPRRDRS